MQRSLRPNKTVAARKGGKERRRWPRLALAIPVFVRGRDESGRDMLEFGTIVNISAGGVLFANRKRPHSRIFLEIPSAFPGVDKLARAKRRFRARVLRIVDLEGWYWCAARFSGEF